MTKRRLKVDRASSGNHHSEMDKLLSSARAEGFCDGAEHAYEAGKIDGIAETRDQLVPIITKLRADLLQALCDRDNLIDEVNELSKQLESRGHEQILRGKEWWKKNKKLR